MNEADWEYETPRMVPRRYGYDTNGTVQPVVNGRTPKELNITDMLMLAIDTDLLLDRKVSERTLAAIKEAGYLYQGGKLIPATSRQKIVTKDVESGTSATKSPSRLEMF